MGVVYGVETIKFSVSQKVSFVWYYGMTSLPQESSYTLVLTNWIQALLGPIAMHHNARIRPKFIRPFPSSRKGSGNNKSMIFLAISLFHVRIIYLLNLITIMTSTEHKYMIIPLKFDS